MLLRFKKTAAKTNDALDENRDTKDDVSEADFIPYAFHYDPHTLITKNGELLQSFRITRNEAGVDYESPEPGVMSLRDVLRKAINTTVTSDKFSYWFHTIRRRVPLNYSPAFSDNFPLQLHEAWVRNHKWQYGYINEVYVTVLREGQPAELFDLKDAAIGILPARNRKHHEQAVEQFKSELDVVCERLRDALKAHTNITRLEMVERAIEGGGVGLFSEPLELMHYLVNMQSAPVPVVEMDASRQLSNHELTFGFDAVESRAEDGKRRFAGILTLKGTQELSTTVLDKCLQLPEELIVTQAFNYVPKQVALETRKATKEIIDMSLDPLIAHVSGLTAAVASDRGTAVDFGEQHTGITILRDQYKQLDKAIGDVQESFAKLGLICVREELKLEDCYWAQLPGNFPFLCRRGSTASRMMGGLARLNQYPSGRQQGHWGAPVAIVPTVMGTPYRFHFHHGDVGHTAVLDFNSFADERGTALINFLLAHSRQYGTRIMVMDRNYTAKPLTHALEGKYYHPLGRSEGTNICNMNPLSLPDTPRNRAFLASWLSHFLMPEVAHEDATRQLLHAVLEELYALPLEERTLLNALQFIERKNETLVDAEKSPLITLFSSQEDTLDFSAAITGVELYEIASRTGAVVPVFTYLLHRMALMLDGTPTIIVMHEAWSLLDNDFFAPRIASLLDMLRQNNALMLFSTRRFEDYAESFLTKEIMRLTPTKIFVPDDIAADYYADVTGLTKHEARTLMFMERQKGQFVVKHGPEVVECALPLDELEKEAKILSGDTKALRLMQIQNR